MRVISDVSQGSMLGPLLFIIFISDIPEELTLNKFILLFADDVLHLRIIDTHVGHAKLHGDLAKQQSSADHWGMQFQVYTDKCYLMHMHT